MSSKELILALDAIHTEVASTKKEFIKMHALRKLIANEFELMSIQQIRLRNEIDSQIEKMNDFRCKLQEEVKKLETDREILNLEKELIKEIQKKEKELTEAKRKKVTFSNILQRKSQRL